jgi:hypothetical protein
MALLRTDVSEKRTASNTNVTRIGELGTTLAVNGILHSHRLGNLKSYTIKNTSSRKHSEDQHTLQKAVVSQPLERNPSVKGRLNL